MPTVDYPHVFAYRYSDADNDERYPGLIVEISNPARPELPPIEIDVWIDSGCGRSLLDGEYCALMGMELFAGRPFQYVSTSGQSVDARLHRVRLSHPDLGIFELEVGFSTSRVQRNLLGRDWFHYVQIGFQERLAEIYVNSSP